MDRAFPAGFLKRWQRGARIVALTGAGVSAESGVPTFRGDGGLWRGHDPTALATPEAFARDPELVWEFYDGRRATVAACEPNAAHRALAELEEAAPGFVLVTQNVDGLHARAGSRNVLRLHGDLFEVRCTREGKAWRDERARLPRPLPPLCDCGAPLRPGVVWFGEALDPRILSRAEEAVGSADVVLVVGTSSLVYPAAALPHLAADAGAYVVEVDPEETALSSIVDLALREPAGKAVPALREALA